MKKSGLGRGLDVLLPELDTDSSEDPHRISDIPLHLIDINPDQPRKSFPKESLEQLAESIASNGLIQPIIVTENDGRYQIVAGERRFRAARIAGLKQIPALVQHYSASERLETALIENLQREDLNPIEEAAAIRDLITQCNYTQETAAQRLGMSRPAVANALRLLSLPPSIMDLISEGKLSAGHGRALCGVDSEKEQLRIAGLVVRDQLSVRQLEALIGAGQPKNASHKTISSPALSVELKDLQERITHSFGIKTVITGNEDHGKITLLYHSKSELEHLFNMLQGMNQ